MPFQDKIYEAWLVLMEAWIVFGLQKSMIQNNKQKLLESGAWIVRVL